MADINLLLEAEKRGILPPDKAGLLAEARKRGLVPATEPPPEASPTPEAAPYSPFGQIGGIGPGEGMGAGAMAAGALRNLPASGAQLAADVTAPIHSPIQTAKGIGQIAKNPGSLIDMAKERYGGIENLKRTFAEDPAGMIADLSMVMTGGGAGAARLGGKLGTLAKGSKGVAAASALERGGRATATAGRAIDPFRLPGRVTDVPKAPEALSQALGWTTGAQATPIKVAFRSGKAGGAKSKAFLQSIKGQIPMDEVVEHARSAVSNMHESKMAAYKQGIAGAFKETGDKPISFSKIADTAEQVLESGTFKGVDITKSSAGVKQAIMDSIDQWKKLDPSEFHTVEGMDAFRKSVGDVLDSTGYGTPERRMANKVYFAVRKSIEAQAPGYGAVLKNYHDASKNLKDLERALSLGDKAATETAVRKLQAVMRNDVTSGFGKRAEYAKQLEGAGGELVEPMLAGQALNSWLPRGIQRIAGPGAMAGGVGAGAVNPLALLLAPLFSPRMVGTSAYRTGKLAKELGKAPGGSGQAAFQAGRSR